MTEIRLARVYDAPSPADGFRVLVDRLWPRGISKERLPLDLWATDAAPSAELRTWWHHDPERFDEFADAFSIGDRTVDEQMRPWAEAQARARGRRIVGACVGKRVG